MGKTKPPYPAAFKQQIVELFQAGRSQSELACEFDVSAGSIANWVARASADSGKPLPGKDVLTSAEREKLVRLRRENRRLQTERDILAKACVCLPGKARRRSLRLRADASEPSLSNPHHGARAGRVQQRLPRLD